MNKLIIDINNNKAKKEDAVERLKKSISDLDQPKQKQSTVLWNKMVQVVYSYLIHLVLMKSLNYYLSKN